MYPGMRRLTAAVLLLAAPPAFPCSAFLQDGPSGPVVGKSYDWSDERGLAIVNKRGMAKRALVLSAADEPATWRSRFASLTLNQYGRELPNGGMNEAGLVVEVLVLAATETEPPDGRPVVTELDLVQYLLDQAETTPEAVSLARTVRVVTAYAPLHYFVCDAAGACAVLELIDGRLVVSTGADLPVRAVTNSAYAESVGALGRGAGDRSSLGRFATVAGQLRTPPRTRRGGPVPAALAILDSVRSPSFTKWNVVYEPAARRVHFRTRNHPALKTVSLDRFAPGCVEPAQVLDLASGATGDVTGQFVPYRPETNRALVEATLTPLRGALPPGIVQRVAEHPASSACDP